MESAFYPLALTRTRVRSHSSKKLETPSDHDNDDINDVNDNGDGQSSEKLDNDHSQPRCVQRKGVRAAGDGGRQNTAASGPARTTKSRVRGESSVKRKEQNRVAQRAFRLRQKSYFIDLEKEVVEQSSQIQTITKSNRSLMETMERLQRENIALKAAKAPNFTGISPLSDLAFDNDEPTGLDLHGVDAPVSSGAGESSSRQHDVVPEEDVLVSVKDLAPVNKKKKKKQSKPESTTRQPPPVQLAARSSSSRSPSSSPHSRSIRQASPEQFVTSGPAFSSDCYRRQSSNASRGSVSQTSALAASDSPRDASSSKAFSREPAQMNVQQISETVNNPTWGGMDEWGSTARSWTTLRGSTSTDASASSDLLGLALYHDGTTNSSQQSFQKSVDHARISKETHHAGYSQPSHSASLYDQHQYRRQQQEQQQRPVDLARRYSEALLRYHAEAPVNSMAHGRRATFDDPSRMPYSHTQAGPIQLDQSMVGRSLDDNMTIASYNGWMNPWQGNGSDHMNASQNLFEQNMNQMHSQAATSQHQPIPPPTPVMFMQHSQAVRPDAQEQSQQIPTQAAYQAKALAGVAPGLKSAAHGGMMPFTENLTPIDGLGPLDNPFRPNFHDPARSGPVWSDLGDLNGGDDQMYGIDPNNAGMSFDTAMDNTFASL